MYTSMNIRGVLPQLASSAMPSVVFGHVHIQKRQLVAFQTPGGKQLLAAGADGGLYLNLPGRENRSEMYCHLCSEGRIIVTNQNVHVGYPFCYKKHSSVPAGRSSPICIISHLCRPFVNQRRNALVKKSRKKFVVEAKRKDEHHHNRQHIGQVAAHPVLHFEALAGVDFFL